MYKMDAYLLCIDRWKKINFPVHPKRFQKTAYSVEERNMNKKRIVTITVALLVAATALFASAASEAHQLWIQADNIVDGSAAYLPRTRTIDMQTFDASGNVLETAQATVYQTLTDNGRNIDIRTAGDREVLDVLGTFSNGGIVTPFDNDLFSMTSKATGTETVDGKTCTVYEAKMAFGGTVIGYAPDDTLPCSVFGWRFTNDPMDYACEDRDSQMSSFNGNFTGDVSATVWLDQHTGTLVKLENDWILDNGKAGERITLKQVVNYETSTVDGSTICLPSSIAATGKLVRTSGVIGVHKVVEFSINETQEGFFSTK